MSRSSRHKKPNNKFYDSVVVEDIPAEHRQYTKFKFRHRSQILFSRGHANFFHSICTQRTVTYCEKEIKNEEQPLGATVGATHDYNVRNKSTHLLQK